MKLLIKDSNHTLSVDRWGLEIITERLNPGSPTCQLYASGLLNFNLQIYKSERVALTEGCNKDQVTYAKHSVSVGYCYYYFCKLGREPLMQSLTPISKGLVTCNPSVNTSEFLQGQLCHRDLRCPARMATSHRWLRSTWTESSRN